MNIKLFGLFKAPVWVKVGSVDFHLVSFGLKSKSKVDDKLFCSSNAEIRVENSNFLTS